MSDRQRANLAEDELRRLAKTGDPLTDWQRGQVGKSARIHFPLRGVVQLRVMAPPLRVLASKLQTLSWSKEADWYVLRDAYYAIKMADELIRTGQTGE